MKKILIITFCLIMLCSCENKNNNSDINIDINANSNQTSTEKENKIILDDNTNYGKLVSTLLQYSRELYDKKEYVNYSKKDGMYFISLKELNEIYNYDISIYKNAKGDICNINESGITFDIQRTKVTDLKVYPTMVTLIGCND